MTQQNCFKLPACQPAQDSLCPIASSHCMRKPQPLMRCSPSVAPYIPHHATHQFLGTHMIEEVYCVCTPSTIFHFFLIRPAPTDGHSNECINFVFPFRSTGSVWWEAKPQAPERHHASPKHQCTRWIQELACGSSRYSVQESSCALS